MIISPKGYRFATAQAGFRKEGRADLALVVSDVPAAVAAVFTQNRFPAAPVIIGREAARKAEARAILVNSGQANACTGEEGLRRCQATRELVGKAVGIDPDSILPASTGVIGPQLVMERWQNAVPHLAASLGKAGAEDMARAILTTDAFPKTACREIRRPDGRVRILAIAKGAGMICPDMATMICVVLTDARIDPALWKTLLPAAVDKTFNRVSVDGDTSTNDTVYALANGASGCEVEEAALAAALEECLAEVAYLLVKDGEGATKVAHIRVSGAKSEADAALVARAVGHSQLVKTALYGRDANWGRIVAAAGRSGADFDPDRMRLVFCGVELFKHGQPTAPDFDEALSGPLKERDLTIDIELGDGEGAYTLLASDLSHDYVSLNADYRS